jgi:hypothetical protein
MLDHQSFKNSPNGRRAVHQLVVGENIWVHLRRLSVAYLFANR